MCCIFFISRQSDIASEVAQNASVSVSQADLGSARYMSVSSNAAIVEEQPKNALLTVFATA